MQKEEIIAKLKENQAFCWILWEIINLKDTFEEPDEYRVKSDGMYRNHTMRDLVENLTNSLMQVAGLPDDYPTYEIVDGLHMTKVREDGITRFLIF